MAGKKMAKNAKRLKQRKPYGMRVMARFPYRLSGFPDTLPTRLQYRENLNLSLGSTVTSYVFRGNSLFDPNFTGTGSQPMFYDQLSAIYDFYMVTQSHIKVTFSHSIADAITCVVIPQVANITWPSIATYAERPRAISKLLDGNNTKAISNYCKSKAALGVKRLETSVHGSNILTNPVNQWVWQIALDAFTVTSGTVHAQVELSYEAEFFGRKEISRS